MKTILTQTFVLTFLSLTLSSCAKKPTDFVALTTSAVTSNGSGSENTKITEILSPLCSQATDQTSCQELGDGCQGEFSEESEGNNEITFIKCIPKVEVVDVADVLNPLPLEIKEPTAIDCSFGLDDVVDVSSPPKSDITTIAIETSNESKIEETTIVSPVVPLPTSCKDVPKKFLIDEGRGQLKVRICHRHEDEKEVTLRIACPALKAHLGDKHSDYLGECQNLGTDN